jgi:4-hydroxy-tetrahydrodipicolinate synthase
MPRHLDPVFFRGLVGTPVTPFAADNRIDEATLQRLVDFLVRSGVDALALPMHIGESLNLSSEERRLVARLAVEAVAGRVPVLVNASLPGTDEVIALSRHAEQIGAQGVVVITPYHWRPSPEGLIEHFATVAGAVGISLVAYNYPARLGVTVTAEILAEMLERRPNIVGLKDAGLDMEYFTEICRVSSGLRPGFGVFSGVEYILPAMAVGAAGSFSACGAVAPRLVKALYDACASGDFAIARPLQYRLSHLYTIISVGYPGTIKAAMEIMGRPCGAPRRPIEALAPEAMRRLEGQLESLSILSDEPHGWES